jgi:cytochrome c oxidase subunit 3
MTDTVTATAMSTGADGPQAISTLDKMKHDWRGGVSPFNISYGKLMMWIFLLSDTFTFGALLVAYGSTRFSLPYWPDANDVFSSFFGLPWKMPMASVSLMTFILIMSSVTMVLAVHAGHNMQKKEVAKWMTFTIIGGLLFLGCQAFEWTDLIKEGVGVGQNMLGPIVNGHHTPGPGSFGAFFYLVTGFHGCHVFSGVIINIVILINVLKGTYEKRGHYEMVEKVGLYWHFVALVGVYVCSCY